MEDKKHGKGWNQNIRMGGRSRKDVRRAAAFARDAEAKKLTLEQKMVALPKEGAHRQRARYLKQIEIRDIKRKELEAKKKEKKEPVASSGSKK